MRPEPVVVALGSFDSFAAALGRRIDHPVDGWAPTDLLTERLEWDSLRAVEVLAWLDQLGVELPAEVVTELRTLGDLHHYVVTIGGRGETATVASRRPLVGARVRLEPLTARHEDAARVLYTTGDHLTRYRLRGVTPSPEGFHQALWDRVVAQFVVVGEGGVLGLVSAFEPDFRNRHVHIAVVGRPDAPLGSALEGTCLLVEHLFAEFDMRKVYAEVLAPHLEAFASGGGRLFVVEGRLTEHEYADGRYQDMVVLAVSRERWAAHVDGLLGPRADPAV